MRKCYPENFEPLRYLVARLVRKCPHLTNIILHGLDMCTRAISHVCRSLPVTMKGVDMARNPKVTDDDVQQLMKQCPDLKFLDVSETGVTIQIITGLLEAWGHCLHSLSLPNTVA